MIEKTYIVDIKRNALDDGPGIRTLIFFKGCPLSCVWCQNPEAKSPFLELSFDKGECSECMVCLTSCDQNAINFGYDFRIDRSICNLCGLCVDICPNSALNFVGKEYSIEELMKIVEQEKVAENTIEQARRNAEETIKTAKEKANKIIMEAKSVDSKKSQHEINKESEEKKRRLKEELEGQCEIEVVNGHSQMGSGSLPAQDIPTKLISLIPKSMSADALGYHLRAYEPPIFIRIVKDELLLDFRTIRDDEIKIVEQAIRGIFSGS